MADDHVLMKDIDGLTRIIPVLEIIRIMQENDLKLYGMSFSAILTFLHQYEINGGPLPLTSTEIEKLFARLKDK
jgi:hypothetical protein